MKTVFIINGPNLNLLGKREPTIYGSQTLADIESLCLKTSNDLKWSLFFKQSNHEGQLIDWLHQAGEYHLKNELAGVILNAGAYTHTSIALLDAIKGAGISSHLIELHISNVHAREDFRHHSYISPVARAVIAGLGVQGYSLAIQALSHFQ